MTLKQALDGPERRILVEALELNGWSRQRTAAMLGINRTTLFNKMRKHELLDGPDHDEGLPRGGSQAALDTRRTQFHS